MTTTTTPIPCCKAFQKRRRKRRGGGGGEEQGAQKTMVHKKLEPERKENVKGEGEKPAMGRRRLDRDRRTRKCGWPQPDPRGEGGGRGRGGAGGCAGSVGVQRQLPALLRPIPAPQPWEGGNSGSGAAGPAPSAAAWRDCGTRWACARMRPCAPTAVAASAPGRLAPPWQRHPRGPRAPCCPRPRLPCCPPFEHTLSPYICTMQVMIVKVYSSRKDSWVIYTKCRGRGRCRGSGLGHLHLSAVLGSLKFLSDFLCRTSLTAVPSNVDNCWNGMRHTKSPPKKL